MGVLADIIYFLKNDWKIVLIFVTIFLAFFGSLFLIMALMAWIITWYGSFLVTFVVFFLIGRKIAKFMLFPGHCSFFKRSVEFAQCKKMWHQVVEQVLEQRDTLDTANEEMDSQARVPELIEVNYNTWEMIKSIEYTLSWQREVGTITDDQENLQEKIEILKGSFNSIITYFGDRRITLWELGDFYDQRDETFLQDEFKFESSDIVQRCIRTWTDFWSSFQELVPFCETGEPARISNIARARTFLSNTTFGSIDHLRIEMENS